MRKKQKSQKLTLETMKESKFAENQSMRESYNLMMVDLCKKSEFDNMLNYPLYNDEYSKISFAV